MATLSEVRTPFSGGQIATHLVRSLHTMDLSDRPDHDQSGRAASSSKEMSKPTPGPSSTSFLDNIKDLLFPSSSDDKRNPQRILHNPQSVEEFVAELQEPTNNVNVLNEQGDAPLHSLVKRLFRKKESLLVALLMHSDAEINLPNASGNTAIHLAVEAGDLNTVKLLLAFGANINSLNTQKKTPLDLVEGPYRFFSRQDSTVRDYVVVDVESSPAQTPSRTAPNLGSLPPYISSSVEEKLITPQYRRRRHSSSISSHEEDVQGLAKFLKDHGALRGRVLTRRHSYAFMKTHVQPFMDMTLNEKNELRPVSPLVQRQKSQDQLIDDGNWIPRIPKLYHQLTTVIEAKMKDVMFSLSEDPDEAMALGIQLKEMKMLKEAGSRILFLDGGGIRGLVQIEILSQLEEQTGRRITELFDWVVGTSTGGVIALALIYAKKTLREVRQLYHSIKDDVFSKNRLGIAYNTEALENTFKKVFGSMRMDEVKHPRVIVPAVYKKTIKLKTHFFNNCFDDEFSTQEVWKVARYTSAAPMFFNELDDYVDGGILANNPSATGLTRIQDFFRNKGELLPISLVVSVGSGKLPEEELGRIDVQDFLFFGKHWFNFRDRLKDRVGNLATLLGNAVGEAEQIADNVRSRCREQGITYYRFSPQLEEVIASGETDTDKLVDMVLLSRSNVTTQPTFKQLVLRFHQLSIANRKMTQRYLQRPRLRRSPAIYRRKTSIQAAVEF